jgi:hypothetical protein
MTTQQKIEQLIPNIKENFMTYPLAEEGDYRPTIDIWKISNKKLVFPKDDINTLPFLKTKYHIEVDYYRMDNYSKHTFEDVLNNKPTKKSNKYMYEFSIYNKDDILTNPKYDLDEMLDVAYKLINI